MNKTRLILATLFFLAGCGGADRSLDRFAESWSAAAASNDPAALFDMLDASSRREITQQLETLRGLDAVAQNEALTQMGSPAGVTLLTLPAREYFAILWRQVLAGATVTAKLNRAGQESATLIISAGPDHTERFRVFLEGGRWVWQLPAESMANGWHASDARDAIAK